MESYMAYIIATVAVLFSTALGYIKRSFSYWKKRNVPYLEPNFPFGNLQNPITNKKRQGLYFQEFYEKFKKMGVKYAGIYTYTSPTFIPIDPEYNKHLLIKDFQYFQARGFYSNEKHQPLSANLFTSDGDKWKTLRTKFTPTFTSAKMKMMFNLMTESSAIMADYVDQHVRNKQPLDIKDCVTRLTADIIRSCTFGTKCNSFKDTTFQNMMKDLIDEATTFVKLTFCIALPKIAQFLRIPLFPPKQTEIVANMVYETVKYRKENGVTRNDFLQLVMEMKDKDIVDMTELTAQCILFFLAGYETSATTMTFTLFELARNQDIQERLREEIEEVLERYNGEITYEAVMNMKYLEAVMFETLRQYPPLPSLQRKCIQDYKLPDSDTVIEKGTNIMIPILGFHYDPEYFPDPEKYDPDRFLDDNKDKIPPYVYMPFGIGPRNCIGDRFGKQQVRVGIATLLRKYRFRLNPSVKLPLEYETSFITTSKSNILLDVEAISS